jgi:hypothetical protein
VSLRRSLRTSARRGGLVANPNAPKREMTQATQASGRASVCPGQGQTKTLAPAPGRGWLHEKPPRRPRLTGGADLGVSPEAGPEAPPPPPSNSGKTKLRSLVESKKSSKNEAKTKLEQPQLCVVDFRGLGASPLESVRLPSLKQQAAVKTKTKLNRAEPTGAGSLVAALGLVPGSSFTASRAERTNNLPLRFLQTKPECHRNRGSSDYVVTGPKSGARQHQRFLAVWLFRCTVPGRSAKLYCLEPPEGREPRLFLGEGPIRVRNWQARYVQAGDQA